ncbi:MAG: hypothetical protein JXB06_06445 [Spirochaetales bacterium]|nr:hypothetical protein [Spirochaetales bacterium]
MKASKESEAKYLAFVEATLARLDLPISNREDLRKLKQMIKPLEDQFRLVRDEEQRHYPFPA